MEKHKCKLCSRNFSNGRALGGHMKAHLATLPIPPKTASHPQESSTTSFSFSEEEEKEEEVETVKSSELGSEEKAYVLRENPKKSYRVADPEFSFTVDGGSSAAVIQDGESDTESKKPTQKRSKRSRKPVNFESKKLKLKQSSFVESPEQPVSSVSDTSPDEDVAMCLMMLSRDVWSRSSDEDQERYVEQVEESKIEIKKLKCEECNKKFRSLQALSSHKKICSLNGTEVYPRNGNNNSSVVISSSNDRIFECPYCFKIFGSGQALGGHKRSHLICSATSATPVLCSAKVKVENNLIDLNMPAPLEDDEFSVVSDA